MGEESTDSIYLTVRSNVEYTGETPFAPGIKFWLHSSELWDVTSESVFADIVLQDRGEGVKMYLSNAHSAITALNEGSDWLTLKLDLSKININIDTHTEVLCYNYTNTYTHTHTCIHKMGSDLNN